MDMHSNIHELREHREDTQTLAGEQSARVQTPRKAVAPAVATTVEFGSGWYHDAAIDAAGREAIEARCHPEHW